MTTLKDYAQALSEKLEHSGKEVMGPWKDLSFYPWPCYSYISSFRTC